MSAGVIAAHCAVCGRGLRLGETAYASDWKVIDVSGVSVSTRWDTRYTCEDCEVGNA